mgnify:CR=1 FL=1
MPDVTLVALWPERVQYWDVKQERGQHRDDHGEHHDEAELVEERDLREEEDDGRYQRGERGGYDREAELSDGLARAVGPRGFGAVPIKLLSDLMVRDADVNHKVHGQPDEDGEADAFEESERPAHSHHARDHGSEDARDDDDLNDEVIAHAEHPNCTIVGARRRPSRRRHVCLQYFHA